CYSYSLIFFFFQAEDGIRDFHVTGVQTCALPIFPYRLQYRHRAAMSAPSGISPSLSIYTFAPVVRARMQERLNSSSASATGPSEIGRASCRGRLEISAGKGRARHRIGSRKRQEQQ